MRVAGLVMAYLIGSTPFAYFAGRWLKGIDLRAHGSGNLGATNVYRTLGAPAALVVLLLDAAKGGLPVLLFPSLTGTAGSIWWTVAFGTMAIVGHVRPYFGLMKGGGKGVATASGVFAALAPVPFAASLATFVAVVWVTRIVSLGSMLGAVILSVTVLLLHGPAAPLTLVSVLIALFVIWTHRANIGRLRRGEEAKIGRARGTTP